MVVNREQAEKAILKNKYSDFADYLVWTEGNSCVMSAAIAQLLRLIFGVFCVESWVPVLDYYF
jgi:hypothetical protein